MRLKIQSNHEENWGKIIIYEMILSLVKANLCNRIN